MWGAKVARKNHDDPQLGQRQKIARSLSSGCIGSQAAIRVVHSRAIIGSRAGIPGSYFKMLIARATTSAPMPRDTIASIIISSLAHRLIAETSVGLNAVAVQKASDR